MLLPVGMFIDRVRMGGGVGTAGLLGWDPDLEKKLREGTIDNESTLEEAITKLFVKTEEFIVQMSAPIGFGPVTAAALPESDST